MRALPRPVALLRAATCASVVFVIIGVLLGVYPWKCGMSLADMDLEGTPVAVSKRMLGSR
jgi:hypothetical protein